MGKQGLTVEELDWLWNETKNMKPFDSEEIPVKKENSDKRLNAQELDCIREHAVSMRENNPEMKTLIFRLLGEVTQNRQQTFYQFLEELSENK